MVSSCHRFSQQITLRRLEKWYDWVELKNTKYRMTRFLFFFFFNLAYGMIGPDTSPSVCQKREDWRENFADISS